MWYYQSRRLHLSSLTYFSNWGSFAICTYWWIFQGWKTWTVLGFCFCYLQLTQYRSILFILAHVSQALAIMTFSFLFLLIDLLDEPHIPCFQGLGWCGGCQRNLLSLDAWQPRFLGIHGCVLSRGHSSVLGSCLPASPARELLPRRGGAVTCVTALLCPSVPVLMRPLLSGSEGGAAHLLAPVASSTYYSRLRTPVSEHITITGVIQYHFGRCSQVYLLWAGKQRE